MTRRMAYMCTLVCALLVILVASSYAAEVATQEIVLKKGKNLVGLYVVPEDVDMTSILFPIKEYIEYVRDQKGRSWRVLNDAVRNGIGEWKNTEGYLIFVKDDVRFSVTGQQIDPLKPIDLLKGYNFVPFLRGQSTTADDHFSSIADELEFVRDLSGDVLKKDGDNLVDNGVVLSKGQASLVKVKEAVTLYYRPTVSTSAGEYGTISVSQDVTYGSSHMVTITPDQGYFIVDVKVDGKSIGPMESWSLPNIVGPHTITALFGVRVTTDTDGNGAIVASLQKNDGSVVALNNSTAVEVGSRVVVQIIPEHGYRLKDIYVNGKTVAVLETFSVDPVETNTTLSAQFQLDLFTVEAKADGNGIVLGSSMQVVNAGGWTSVVKAVPHTGFSFSQWSDGSTDNPRVFTSITSDIQVTAQFSSQIAQNQ